MTLKPFGPQSGSCNKEICLPVLLPVLTPHVSLRYSSMDTEDVGFMDSFHVGSDEVASLLRRTKAHCALGPDGISAWMLRSFCGLPFSIDYLHV